MITGATEPETTQVFRLHDILTWLRPSAKQCGERLLQAWSEGHEVKLNELRIAHERCLQKLNELGPESQPSTVLWKTLHSSLQQIYQVIDPSEVEGDIASDFVVKEWRAEFEQVLAEVPSFVSLPIANDYLKIDPVIPEKVGTRHFLRRPQIWLRKKSGQFLATTRGIFRKPGQRREPLRNVALHEFLKYFCELPVARYLLLEWLQMQRQAALQLQQMHQASEDLFDKLLSIDSHETLGQAEDPDGRSGRTEVVSMLPAFGAYRGQFEKSSVQYRSRLDGFLSQLDRNLQVNWQVAGTSVLPNRDFSGQRMAQAWKKSDEEFERDQAIWLGGLRGEQEDWGKDLQLAQLRTEAAQICLETITSLSSKIADRILPALQEPIAMIADSLQVFQKQLEVEESELQGQILAESRSMLRTLRREALPKAMDTLVAVQLIKALSNYLSRIKHVIERLPDEYRIIQRQDLSHSQPRIKLISVELKQLVLEEVFPPIADELEKLLSEVQEALDKLVRDISEIDQIVEFNLEAALELLQDAKESDEPDDAHDVVTEGLERAQDQLRSLVEQTDNIGEKCGQSLLQITQRLNGEIKELGDNEKILELKYRVAKAKTRQELREQREKILNRAKSSLPRLLTAVAKQLGKIQSNFLRLQKLTGLAPASTETEAKLAQFVTQTQMQIDSLPYVYQRLFRVEPLDDDRFFEGREQDMAALTAEFAAWQAGHHGVTALVGEKGSGKTTLLNFAADRIFNRLPIVNIELAGFTICTEENLLQELRSALGETDVESFDALEDRLLQWQGKRAVLVEDIQNLFVRTVDGFDALERFLLLITRTDKEIYWLLTCTLYSWRYLDKAINLSRFFHNVIFLQSLGKEDIVSIVLKRHRVSGYKLLFEEPVEIAGSKKYRKLPDHEARQDFLQDYFFEQLNSLAVGNISVIMMFWQSAIRRIEEDQLVIDPKLDIDYSFLYQLPADELFTLAAILQHETFSAQEHARIFRHEVRQSMMLLNRMTQRGLLFEKSDGGYLINFLLYRPVVQTLSMKNILH